LGTVWARSRLGSCLSSASRIRVSHKRGPAAENVEVLITRLWRVEDSRAELVESFLPLSLRWANRTPPTATERVPKGLFRHCDVCAFASTQVGETWVQFTTLVQPNPVGNIGYPNVLQGGDYEFELKMSGDNLRPVTKRWALSFDFVVERRGDNARAHSGPRGRELGTLTASLSLTRPRAAPTESSARRQARLRCRCSSH
jgi:hypothetical protein